MASSPGPTYIIFSSSEDELSAVLYSGATSTFISQGGTYKGMTVNWQDSKNRCAASFTITGILNGTSTSKTIYGRASTFVKLNNKILINYIDSLD